MMDINKVAFIGLGVMGSPMAGYLQQKGFNTTAYNRTHSKAKAWQALYNGKIAATPGKQPGMLTSCLCASVMTMTCAASVTVTTASSLA